MRNAEKYFKFVVPGNPTTFNSKVSGFKNTFMSRTLPAAHQTYYT